MLAVLDRQAATRAEEPFLFYPSGPDWRWVSWRETAALARGIASSDEPRAAGVAVAELLANADSQRLEIPLDSNSPPGRRDLSVVHGPAGDEVAALMAGWSIRTGAALMVELDPERWPLALAWARPTVVAGTARDLDRLAERLGRLEREPRRLTRRLGPLGRVRAVVRVGGGEWPGADWWLGLGLPAFALET